MDPIATLYRCDQALSDCDIDAAHDALWNYRAWRARGGSEPWLDIPAKRGDAFADYCSRRLESLLIQSARAPQ